MDVSAVYRIRNNENIDGVEGYSCLVVVKINNVSFLSHGSMSFYGQGATEEEAKQNAIGKFDQFVEVLHDVEIKEEKCRKHYEVKW